MAVFAGQSVLTGEYTDAVNVSVSDNFRNGEDIKTPVPEKKVYLTFDDGPGVLTKQYLDILREKKVCATFFVIGSQVEEQPELVEREINEGHEVGIHSYSHESGQIYQSADSYYKDVCRVQNILEEQFGYRAKVWRFPWGSANGYISRFKKDVTDRLNKETLDYADWNVSGEDSVGNPSVETILKNIKKDCFTVEDPVILLHDSNCNQATLDSLEEIIRMLQERGYTFETISKRSKPCHFGEYSSS
jgi:peptidoglycan/xylan/chitin deacetylase (PgdA/CDA1 family)